MKKLLVPLVVVLPGCAVQPQQYDLSTSGAYEPLQTRQTISTVKFDQFRYEPHIGISQNNISHLGCLPCENDGGTPGILFANSIAEIVQAEIENAFKEVMNPSKTGSCSIGATIHMAAWDAMNGDSIVDLTYTLSKNGQVEYIKRIRGHHDAWLFEMNEIDRFLAKASRKSVNELVNNYEFLKEFEENCSNS